MSDMDLSDHLGMVPVPFSMPESYRRQVERLSVDELREALIREAELRGGWFFRACELAAELERCRADG